MKNEFKIKCSKKALNVFALLVPSLFLVVFKPFKRKRAVGGAHLMQIHLKPPRKVGLHVMIMTKSSLIMTVEAPRYSFKKFYAFMITSDENFRFLSEKCTLNFYNFI